MTAIMQAALTRGSYIFRDKMRKLYYNNGRE